MKIYKRRRVNGQQHRSRLLVTVPDVTPGRIKYRLFELCAVPGFPDDIPAAKAYLEEETTNAPRGTVKEGHLNLSKYELADEDLHNAMASLARFCHLFPWDSPEEAEIWVADNVTSIPDIKAFLGLIAVALVDIRDSSELVQEYRD